MMMTKRLGEVTKIELCHLEQEFWVGIYGPNYDRELFREFLRAFTVFLNHQWYAITNPNCSGTFPNRQAYRFISNFRVALMRNQGIALNRSEMP